MTNFSVMLLAENNPLVLDPVNILLHMLNLVILITGLWFLMFKPIKRYVKKRSESISKIIDDNNKLSAEAEAMKNEYEILILEAKKELSRANEEASIIARERADSIIDDAHEQAKALLAKSQEENIAEKARLIYDVKKQVADISVAVANKILEREISEKDNTRIIEEALESWTK